MCRGDGCSGGQNSGTGKHLLGVARAGINRTNGSPLMLAVGDDGTRLRFVDDGEWQSLSTGTSRDLNGVVRSGNSLIVVGDEGEVLQSTDNGGDLDQRHARLETFECRRLSRQSARISVRVVSLRVSMVFSA